MKHSAFFDPELLEALLRVDPTHGLRELSDAASRDEVEISFRRLEGVGGPLWDARAHFLLRIEIAADVKQHLDSPVTTMENTTPSWAHGLPTAVEIAARQMVSVLRFYPREGAEFQIAMQHLCRMLTAKQEQKDTCPETPKQSREDAYRSTGDASGAASVDTSSNSTRNSAPAAPTAANASAKTTTSASVTAATSERSATTADRPSARRADAHAKTDR